MLKLLLVILIICIATELLFIVFNIKFLKFKSDYSSISQKYESVEGNFVIKGNKNKFVITKNNNISFLVENGQIVACKDKRISKDYKYYGGE